MGRITYVSIKIKLIKIMIINMLYSYINVLFSYDHLQMGRKADTHSQTLYRERETETERQRDLGLYSKWDVSIKYLPHRA